MSTKKTMYRVLSLDEAFADTRDDDDRSNVRIRRELGVESFAIGALQADAAGAAILREHDEVGPGADRNERIFLVIAGHATFTVDGHEIDAPAGTVIHLPDPEARRAAVAKVAGTTLLGIGGRPGEPYRPSPGEALESFFPLHEAKDYETAAAVCGNVLERYPGNALALFNLACCEALLGRADGALAHVHDAIAAHPALLENARTDTDLDSLRGEPSFQALVA